MVMVANILKIYFPEDVIARFGGEEFCIQSCGSYDEFVNRLEQMRQRVEKTPVPYQDESIQVTISVGVSNIDGNLDQQIKVADDRLYQAKGMAEIRPFTSNEHSLLRKIKPSAKLGFSV